MAPIKFMLAVLLFCSMARAQANVTMYVHHGDVLVSPVWMLLSGDKPCSIEVTTNCLDRFDIWLDGTVMGSVPVRYHYANINVPCCGAHILKAEQVLRDGNGGIRSGASSVYYVKPLPPKNLRKK